MKTCCKIILSLVTPIMLSASVASAQIAKWTFESSIPTNAGPHSPEIGAGSALGFHASGSAVYSNPAGNGSAESFSVNFWGVGDYFEFSLSTVGYAGIGVSFDQTGSNTGPRDFDLAYSTDGSTFTAFASYAVTNGSWSSGAPTLLPTSYSFDLSSITALDNDSSVYFRLINTSTVAITGGTVATAGSGRVDNFTVSVVPEPSSVAMLGLGLTAWLIRRRN